MQEKNSLLEEIKNTNNINDYAYINHEDLTILNIPNNIKRIGERAFSKCKNIKKIILSDNIEYIGASAFSECENIEEIILPKNLKKLNYRTFADCKRLKKVIIPEGLEEIDWGAFSGCTNIEEIVLPNSLKSIGKQAFLNCKKLKKINIPSNITSLPDECFKGCNNLDIKLNDNITKLGNRTFEDCYKQKQFPKNVIEFGINCFRNCRNIKEAILNNNITSLPDGIFDGCINLEIIKSNNKINIGKRCFRNCKNLKEIPSFIKNFNERAFENCIGLTKIKIIDSKIPMACFRGCINLKEIEEQEKIFQMESFAFSGCKSIEKINLSNIDIIPAEAFSNCTNLKEIIFNITTKKIETRAFYKCVNIEELLLPDTIKIIKKESFKKCNKVKKLTIPASLKSFGEAALSYMNSLEYLEVSPLNKTFITPDHKILINQIQQKLVLYATGCKDKSYSLKDYVVSYDDLKRSLIRPITGIGKYAFAGANNLEELIICACVQDIESTSFYDCHNLKKLTIEAISLFTCPGIHIRENGNYYYEETAKNKVNMPFEIITFTGELVQIYTGALEHFKNVKKINLPNDHIYNISSNAFIDCILLEEIDIPNQVMNISQNALPLTTKVKFENGLNITGLVELNHNNEYIGDYKLYTLDDGTYYIEQNNKIIKITKSQIDKLCTHPEEIRNNPILFLDFINDLKKHNMDIKLFYNGILMSNISLENRKILFDNIKKDDIYSLFVLTNSGLLDTNNSDTKYLLQKENFKEMIQFINLLKKYNIKDSILCNKKFITCCRPENFEWLITYDLPLFIKIIKDSKLLEVDETLIKNNEKGLSGNDLTNYILLENTISNFIKYVKKYNIKDKFLIDKPFISICDNPLSEKFFKVFDSNIKRLIKLSKITDNYLSVRQNLNDLLVLLKITGALEEDPIIKQRASTFISEKIFEKILPNGKENEYQIIGDDIHRIFNFPFTREEYDEEFSMFFLENYQELIKEEKNKSGIIQRIYLNFREISKTCTSHKGSQRKLKVTLKKCLNYLSTVKFDGVTKETEKLAQLIGKWYDNNATWINAQKIYNESLKAPRNIFTKIEIDDEGNIIYDMNPLNDIKEALNENFSYEWLPKQDYDNLILGKYCNCCAHIEGAGQGIMRASMILDNVQNLVIRNENGTIIAKSTIYVNKEKGYAVFNNVESSLLYKDDEYKEKIYKAFIRGTEIFLKTYNENNPDKPITCISIGSNRNTILNYLTIKNNHPEIPIQESLEFGLYSLNGSGYSGDWKEKQRLVLKR